MTEKSQINQILEQFKHISETTASIRIEENNPTGRRIGGMFSMDSHTITLYKSEIFSQAEQFFPGQDIFYDYLKVILAHELGHANDPYLKVLAQRLENEQDFLKRKKIELVIEVQAWKFARKLLMGDVPYHIFRKIRTESLAHYYESIDQLIKDNVA
ncbi:ImmA/IrrE family metallo-endopeptidase [Fictibacillus aquaticus]|uniref:Uncharacterized protein n=1 Tax=Fictibacillus aquaticus TaxID=2021314 RepID=A0A235FB52_9BACL|nr:hypothetical protein [Fictibacillus aquaticus]OYD58571.1 hypothetical protein CGZ90_01315 [Fictibacillus aquaticus]